MFAHLVLRAVTHSTELQSGMHESVTSFIEAETSQLLKEIDSALGNKYDLGKTSRLRSVFAFSPVILTRTSYRFARRLASYLRSSLLLARCSRSG